MEFTASFTSAVSSITTGVLPAPTPKAGFPEEYAALTIPGPPVARMQSAAFITSFVNSREGTSIHPMMPSGAPAFTAASKTILAAAMVQSFARGCGLMMMAFLVFREIKVLKIAVEVGFVVGITAAINPNGSAIFLIPNAESSSITPQVFVLL